MHAKRHIADGITGIPSAPDQRRIFQAVDYDFQERKVKYADRLPLMTAEEVLRRKQPYHVLLLHDMMLRGYFSAVQEMNNIIKKEDRERRGGKYPHLMGEKLIYSKEKLNTIIGVLATCQEYTDRGEFEAAVLIRKNLGEKLMKEGELWLAKHFFFSALQSCPFITSEKRSRYEAEIHCFLAFLARDNATDLEQALEAAVDHLTMCRELSMGQSWQFKPNILTIKLKTPVTLHGLREEYDIIDGCSFPLYLIATLLEHEMLISLANQILHLHKYPTEDEIHQAQVFADDALRLAFEVRQPTALSSALLRFGIVLRHTGAFDDAIAYLQQLQIHSELTGDYETYAIACHDIAHCQMGKHDSIGALESLAKQKTSSEKHKLDDLKADALQELGHILLQEGQLWESEECYTCAFEVWQRLEGHFKQSHNHVETNLVLWSIAAGQKMWSRFAGLARNEESEHITALTEWKNRRQSLVPVPPPNYETELIDNGEHDYFAPMPSRVKARPYSSDSEQSGSKSISFGYGKLVSSENLKEAEEEPEPFESDKHHRSKPADKKHRSLAERVKSSKSIGSVSMNLESIVSMDELGAKNKSFSLLSGTNKSLLSFGGRISMANAVENSKSESAGSRSGSGDKNSVRGSIHTVTRRTSRAAKSTDGGSSGPSNSIPENADDEGLMADGTTDTEITIAEDANDENSVDEETIGLEILMEENSYDKKSESGRSTGASVKNAGGGRNSIGEKSSGLAISITDDPVEQERTEDKRLSSSSTV